MNKKLDFSQPMHTLIEAPDGLYLYSNLTQIAFHPLDFHEYYASIPSLSSIATQLIQPHSIQEINTLIPIPNSFFDIEQYRLVRSKHKFTSFNFASFYSKRNVEYDLGKEDNLIVQCIEYIENMEKEVEKEVKGLGDIYVMNNYVAEILWTIVNYKEDLLNIFNKNNTKIENEVNSNGDNKVESFVLSSLKASFSKDELQKICSHTTFSNVPQICLSLALSIINKRLILSSLYAYLESKLNLIAPNLFALLGSRIAAELIAKAGSLSSLSKCPSSTLQLLGAEKALFRALKNRTNTPKHGVLYKHGRLARTVACKASIAARIDCYSAVRTNEYGLEMRKMIEQKELGIKSENTDTVLMRVYKKLNEQNEKDEKNEKHKKIKLSDESKVYKDKMNHSATESTGGNNEREIFKDANQVSKLKKEKISKEGKVKSANLENKKNKDKNQSTIKDGKGLKVEKSEKHSDEFNGVDMENKKYKDKKKEIFSRGDESNDEFKRANIEIKNHKDVKKEKKISEEEKLDANLVSKKFKKSEKISRGKEDINCISLEKSKKENTVNNEKNKKDGILKYSSSFVDVLSDTSMSKKTLDSSNSFNLNGREFKYLKKSNHKDTSRDKVINPISKKDTKEVENVRKHTKSNNKKSKDMCSEKPSNQSDFEFPSPAGSNIFYIRSPSMDSGSEKNEQAGTKTKKNKGTLHTDSSADNLGSTGTRTKRKAAVTRVVTKESEEKMQSLAKKQTSKKKKTNATPVKNEEAKEKKKVVKKQDESDMKNDSKKDVVKDVKKVSKKDSKKDVKKDVIKISDKKENKAIEEPKIEQVKEKKKDKNATKNTTEDSKSASVPNSESLNKKKGGDKKEKSKSKK